MVVTNFTATTITLLAMSSEREGYAFYSQTGPQARLSNSCRTAERHLARVEFQNAVVMSSGPLEDGRPFQVLIEGKVSTWSGSVIIGATTIPPERFSFPANLSCLTSGCWVVNGSSLWKNGCRKLPNYVPETLEMLVEGSSVGVVKRGQSLHFLINGAALSAAEEALPPNSKVWALVDLYGQCSRVSIVDCENRQSSSSSTTPLLFHSRCGDHAQILAGGTVACRKSPESDFNHSVVISNRPLDDSELFEVEISEMQARWSGSVELGVTTHNPEEFEFPSTLSKVTSGAWIMSGCSIVCNGSTIIQDYAKSLDTLKVGDRVGFRRQSNGSLVYYINGAEQGVAAANLPQQLYAVVDIYGRCSQIRLTTAVQGERLGIRPTQDVADNTPERREACVSQEQPTTSRSDLLRFHRRCGENVELLEGGRAASRRNPYEEYTGATVLTSRPLRPGEMFEVMVGVIVDSWSGCLQMGVCQVDPELIDFEDIEELTDLCIPHWILSGSDLSCEDSSPDTDYPLDLDSIPEGSKVGLKVTRGGNLHFFINGADMGVAASALPTEGLYGCAEIYGTCAQVSIVDHQQQPDNVARDHMTSESVPVLSLDDRVTSTASNSNHREESVPVSHSPWRHQFHHVHGHNISLLKDRIVAKRFQGFDQGLVFSHRPLQPMEVFEVELTELSSRAWQGSLRVGLVAKLPRSLPNSISELDKGCWALVGSSLVHNGLTAGKTFNAGRLHLKADTHLAVWYEIDGWMHVAVDDMDLGPMLPIMAKLPYAVVDLYGAAKSVRIIPIEKSSGAPNSDQASIQWSAECGSHVQLSSDYRSAKRTRSYSNGILVSSFPLPNDHLFQCTIKELDRNWEGTLSLGVTSQFPRQACLVEKAQELKKRSYILCTEAGETCLYVGGKEVCKLPGISLSSLQENDTVGILCKSCDRTLHFFISSTHLEVKLPDGDMRLPTSRYAVVDMYGRCSAVELKGLEDVEGDVENDDGGLISIQIDKEQLSHIKRNLKHSKTQSKTSHQEQQAVVGAATIEQEPFDVVGDSDVQQQIEPDEVMDSRIGNGAAKDQSGRSVCGPSPLTCVPTKKLCDSRRPSYHKCLYFERCRNFLERLSVPDVFLSPEPEYSKCYCSNCCKLRGEPDVKYSGAPPGMKYAVPHGWVKFGLKLSFGPQADNHNSFATWHKAYHGTSPGKVRPILDHGGLMLPGSSLLDGGVVSQPPGHYTDDWKPANHDPNRIFVSPSIKYCAFHDVYTKKHPFKIGGKQYNGRVCFKVLIKPNYHVSGNTIATHDGEEIDKHFKDSELEWSTNVDRGIYLYGLMIQVDGPQ